MMDILVETKNEYIINLCNILSPYIFTGIKSIYDKASEDIKTSGTDKNKIFMIFQEYLKLVKKWSTDTIVNEMNRILYLLNKDNPGIDIYNLIKVIIKSYFIIMTFDPYKKNQNNIENQLNKIYDNNRLETIIHKFYIETIKEFWDNPYLFYDGYPDIEIKRNYKEAMNIIKNSIKETIRKILPLKLITEYYLISNYTAPTAINELVNKTLHVNNNVVNNEIHEPEIEDKKINTPKKILSTEIFSDNMYNNDIKDFSLISSININKLINEDNDKKNITKDNNATVTKDDKKFLPEENNLIMPKEDKKIITNDNNSIMADYKNNHINEENYELSEQTNYYDIFTNSLH